MLKKLWTHPCCLANLFLLAKYLALILGHVLSFIQNYFQTYFWNVKLKKYIRFCAIVAQEGMIWQCCISMSTINPFNSSHKMRCQKWITYQSMSSNIPINNSTLHQLVFLNVLIDQKWDCLWWINNCRMCTFDLAYWFIGSKSWFLFFIFLSLHIF